MKLQINCFMPTAYACLYLCLWFCNVNVKKEIKETGREIRKGNPPPSYPAYTSGATYTQFPDSYALPCVLRGKSETVSCGNRLCWQRCLSAWSKRKRPKNIQMCQMLHVTLLPTLALRDVGRGS